MAEAKSEGKRSSGASADTSKSDEKTADTKGSGRDRAETVRSVRKGVATAVWVLAVIAAVILAIGALMVALDFNPHNAIVSFFVKTANNIDFGAFKKFTPNGKGQAAQHSALVKTVLVSWGLAAVIYLVVGKILDRVIRP